MTLEKLADATAGAERAKAKPRWLGRRWSWKKRLLVGAGVSAVGVAGLWIAMHEVPWLGPALAEGARSVLGPSAVAWLEDKSYGVADEINQLRHRNDPPKDFWVTGREVSAPAPVEGKAAPSFPPPRFAPPASSVAAERDGIWYALEEGRAAEPSGAVGPLVKAQVHPDDKRGFAVVAVTAIDLERLDLHLVAGLEEPTSQHVPRARRPGLVPPEHLATVVAAFNGGFRAVHGQWGMRIGADHFLSPRDAGCTVALFPEPGPVVEIGTWKALKSREASMLALRQTPPCLVEGGQLNPSATDHAKGWGATVSGETIIRRSAIGVDKTGKVLFYGMGDALTAQTIGVALKAAGAVSVAQLDVNYSYPRFVLFSEPAAGKSYPEAKHSLIKDVKYRSGEYTNDPQLRDFFYLARKKKPS
jgi:hypothetical protein